ncbi:MAG TPA: (E)-4-hydroxy-3-methylbut-2-enyl-diphosphate synthase [Fibrobacteria bacterium]|nr:(E)-4-hydroxy-3-methylbut-2-enyl-diphosphate synthase [Fibrobacteria bacterium]
MIQTGQKTAGAILPDNPPYMVAPASRFAPARRKTIPVRVGNRWIGGDHPVLVQSMTTTNTKDIDATVTQTLELWHAGCELIRITTPTAKDAECLKDIVAKVRAAGCDAPISADIHFQPRAAHEAVKWADKVRINPGNFVDSKAAGEMKEYDEASFQAGVAKVHETFAPLVREAKERGVALRIGTNHGSLSDRIMWKHGDTVEGMVESALEYLRVCEEENFDQIVFSMKSSNPRVAIQAYRLLAYRLEAGGHKPYPFHVGVTEAGDGEDGRLKSSVGIGSLLRDGLGDTVRVSLTEDPIHEVPVARKLVELCDTTKIPAVPAIEESVSFYNYQRRETDLVTLSEGLVAGGREPVRVGVDPFPASEAMPKGDRKAEWINGQAWPVVAAAGNEPVREIRVSDLSTLKDMKDHDGTTLWSCDPSLPNLTGAYRHLAAWLDARGRKDLIVLRDHTDGTPDGNMAAAARLGAVLADGIGDLIHLHSGAGSKAALNLAYDILQAAAVRRSKPEYVACPGCGRTLFDLQSTTQRIRAKTAHLKNISIAVMGCIVNGPGEMADADFGYVGGAPNKVSLYVGRECVQKNIPEDEAPEALVNLIKSHGRWIEP